MGRSKSRNAGRGSSGSDVPVSAGAEFFGGSGGRWATEQFIKALNSNQPMNASVLRTAGTLRPYEWVAFDDVVISESVVRLRGVADLYARGLVKHIANGMGKTFLQYNKASDMTPAGVSLDGMARTGDDRIEFDPTGLPLPIVHKDFDINLRTLAASRNGGEPLDTMEARTAARKVAEKIEDMLFNGGPQFGGSKIYGYTTAPDRNIGAFVGDAAGRAWSVSTKTGAGMLQDLLIMISALSADGFYGPYGLYVPANTGVILDNDFKANGPDSIRERLRKVENLVSIQTSDQLAADNIVLVQLTQDVVEIVDAEPIQTIQWDTEGGMNVKFKVMGIQIPLVRSTRALKSGIYHMS